MSERGERVAARDLGYDEAIVLLRRELRGVARNARVFALRGRARPALLGARSWTELAQIEEELDSASESSSAWQVSAPGSDSPETSPLSFRLRQQVKDQRAEILASERQLRALEVEADLAAVPPGWRE